MVLKPYQPSRSAAAMERMRESSYTPQTIAEAKKLWTDALGSAPRCADEYITPFSFSGNCFHCFRSGRMTLVFAGFKGESDKDMLLCNTCIDVIL